MNRRLNSKAVADLIELNEVGDSEGEMEASHIREGYYETLREENARLKLELSSMRTAMAEIKIIPQLKATVEKLEKTVDELKDIVKFNQNPPIMSSTVISLEDDGYGVGENESGVGERAIDVDKKGEENKENRRSSIPLELRSCNQHELPGASSPSEDEKDVAYITFPRSDYVQLHKDYDIYLPLDKTKKINAGSLKPMIREILSASFTRKYMSCHSLHGKASNAFKHKAPKPALPVNFVKAVCQAAMSRHSCSEKEVMETIAKKLNNESKLFNTIK